MEHIKSQVRKFFVEKIEELEYEIFQETVKSNVKAVDSLIKAKLLCEETLIKLEKILCDRT